MAVQFHAFELEVDPEDLMPSWRHWSARSPPADEGCGQPRLLALGIELKGTQAEVQPQAAQQRLGHAAQAELDHRLLAQVRDAALTGLRQGEGRRRAQLQLRPAGLVLLVRRLQQLLAL